MFSHQTQCGQWTHCSDQGVGKIQLLFQVVQGMMRLQLVCILSCEYVHAILLVLHLNLFLCSWLSVAGSKYGQVQVEGGGC